MTKIKQFVKDHKKYLIVFGGIVAGGLIASAVSYSKGFYKASYDIGRMLDLAAQDNPEMGLKKFYDIEIATGNLSYDYYDLVKRGVTEIKTKEI